eukprot:scaffold564_cov248-Pinguiococcus_pyrenoidosus.AAC.3
MRRRILYACTSTQPGENVIARSVPHRRLAAWSPPFFSFPLTLESLLLMLCFGDKRHVSHDPPHVFTVCFPSIRLQYPIRRAKPLVRLQQLVRPKGRDPQVLKAAHQQQMRLGHLCLSNAERARV